MSACLPWLAPKRIKKKRVTSTKRNTDESDATPSVQMYLLEGTKATAATLKSISSIIPVPMVSELLDLAIRVVEACESASFIEEDIEKFRQRVCSLGILIVDKVPSDNNLGEDFKSSVRNLQLTLAKIIKDLDEIKRQKKWLLVVFPQLNKDKVDACIGSLDEALQCFNISQNLHMEDVLQKILSKNTQVHDAVLGVKEQLDRMEAAIKPHSSPYVRGKLDFPSLPKGFYGRDADVSRIVDYVSDKSTSRVCITGPGGMGKTFLALSVIHNPAVQKVFGEYRFWVPCIKATSPDLLRRTLYTQLSITAQSFDSLDILIKELNATNDQRLILLDNFETCWEAGEDPDSQAQVKDILNRLGELPHVAIILTITSSSPPRLNIEWKHHALHPLEASAARQAFANVYPELALSDPAKVDELMDAIGHIPLAITLMAANGKDSQASGNDLLKEWRKAGPKMIDDMDRRIKTSFDLIRAKDDHSEVLMVLAVLSMLPTGTSKENLDWWTPELMSLSRGISLLRNAALIEQETLPSGGSHIFLRPTIQAYIHRHNMVPPEVKRHVRDACYKFVLDHKSIPDEPRFKDDLIQLASEENNIQNLLVETDDSSYECTRAQALVAFSFYLFKTKQSIVVARLALSVAIAAEEHLSVAEAHEILGKMYHLVSEYSLACHHFEEASQLFKNLPSGADRLRAGGCMMQLVTTWRYMQDPDSDKMETVTRETSKELVHDETKPYYVGRGLLGVGCDLWYNEEWIEARELFSRSSHVIERPGCLTIASEWFFYWARTEAALSNYLVALDLSQNALSSAEQCGDVYLIGEALSIIARYQLILGCFDEAEPILYRQLKHSQALGDLLGIAQALDQLGYLHAGRDDMDKAIYFYTESQTQYVKFDSTMLGALGRDNCARNLVALKTFPFNFSDLYLYPY